jgi:hypothetical protein
MTDKEMAEYQQSNLMSTAGSIAIDFNLVSSTKDEDAPEIINSGFFSFVRLMMK